MSNPNSIPNHTQDQHTGYLESNGFIMAFDSEKKQLFLAAYKKNGLRFWRTCSELGIKGSTVHKHYKLDPAFKADFDQAEAEYADELEGMSRDMAMTPKGVIDRMCQLKAILPAKYGGHENRNNGQQIVINVDSRLLEAAKNREKVLEAEVVAPKLADAESVK